MALTQTTVSWRGITIVKAGDYHLRELTGWEELPNISFDSVQASNGYGSLVTTGTADPRIVTVSGWCFSSTARDSLLSGFWAGGAPQVGELVTESLTITHAGLTLSADAQLVKASAAPEVGWAAGRFGFVLTWRCPDPLRYGSLNSSTASITAPVDGVVYPVTYPITYPAQPPSGTVTTFNAGNAKAPVVVTLLGPLATNFGVACVTSAKLMRFGFPIALGDALVIDTSQGAAFLNGAFRSPLSDSCLFDELRVPVGASTFQALGDPTGSGAAVTVAFRPAYW
jgi:hypothetical protein